MKTLQVMALSAMSAAMVLSACATTAPATKSAPTRAAPKAAATHRFVCDDNSRIDAAYSADGSVAQLNISLPKISLKNKSVRLTQAIAGSGARYVNESEPKINYDWHTKADMGVLTIRTYSGHEYSVNCKK